MDVAGSLDPEEVVNRSLRHLRDSLEVDWAALLQVEGDGGRVIGARGQAPIQIGQRLCLDHPLVRQAMEQPAPAATSSNTESGPVASVPLTIRDRLDAVLLAGRSPGESFSEADLMSLIQIGTLAMLARRNALHYRAEQEATQRAQVAGRRLASGIEVALDLAGRVEPDEVVQQLLVRAVEATDAGAGSLSTVQGPKARLIATHNRAAALGAIEPEPLQDSLIASAIQERKPIQERKRAQQGQPELTGLAMPLVLGGEVAGVLAVSRAGPELFAAEDIATLQHIGNVAVLALRNARLLAEAKDSSRAQQKFMNMAAHELRTPLAVIRGYVSMLEDGVFGAPPESWKESLRIVSGKSHELAHLIDEMLLAARLQAGITSMRQDLVDLRGVVAQAAERARPRATMLGATVDLRLPAEPVSIVGDDESLGRVLDNLINNSLTYSDRPARVRITVQPGPKPMVEVADRGWGVPPELSEQIFESFFRGDDPSHPYSPGTGLGLAISREIIERHGGRLVLHSSKPGKGSRFRFWLPGAGQPETAGVGALPVLAAGG
jgi:signal transduction histidine kinase